MQKNHIFYLKNNNVDVIFKNNTFIAEKFDADNGFGTVSFFGNILLIEQSLFLSNKNSEGACVFIDSDYDFRDLTITITSTHFENNYAFSGSAIFFGFMISEIIANFSNITCSSNYASNCNHFIYFLILIKKSGWMWNYTIF